MCKHVAGRPGRKWAAPHGGEQVLLGDPEKAPLRAPTRVGHRHPGEAPSGWKGPLGTEGLHFISAGVGGSGRGRRRGRCAVEGALRAIT